MIIVYITFTHRFLRGRWVIKLTDDTLLAYLSCSEMIFTSALPINYQIYKAQKAADI